MGILLSVYDQNFPPKAKWGVNDIPDLTGKVMIVTGSSSGLGKETAKVLLEHGAKVYLASRNPEKTAAAAKELSEATGRAPIPLDVDFSSLASVEKAAKEFQSKESHLNVLFNNAGVMQSPVPLVTEEGYDLQFGTNVLGHFYFTQLLIPSLKAGAAQSPDHVARVINTSSQNHITGKLDFDTLKDSPARRKMSPVGLYAQATFARIVYSNEFARRYGDQGIISIALHPGSLTTDIGRHLNPIIRRVIHSLCHTPAEGALTQLWGGTMPEAVQLNGGYLIPWARIGHPKKETEDAATGAQLWQWMEDQISDRKAQ